METSSTLNISIPNDTVFYLKEHETFQAEHKRYIASLGLDFVETGYEQEPRFLGIKPNLEASYYIGADWLTKDKAIVVTPKMQEIDYVSLFITALKHAPSDKYFAKFYGIKFNEPKIEAKSLDNIITPLLIIHFLIEVNNLLRKGLKKGYIIQEENLQTKIKGKIILSRQYSKNICNGRHDKIYCKYQEYSVNIAENKLIKKGLIYAKHSLTNMPALQKHNIFPEINKLLNNALSGFTHVSDDIDVNAIKNTQKNKLYSNYNDVIGLAKAILRRYDYSINNTRNNSQSIYPFWIDMSRLFEVYVYNTLEKTYPGCIQFQVKGMYNTAVDFIKADESLIIDAKYKPRYESGNERILDDIREISGYARDEKILQSIGYRDSNEVPKCVIIYPEIQENQNIKSESLLDNTKTLLSQTTQIPHFKNFYKIGINVPRIQTQLL